MPPLGVINHPGGGGKKSPGVAQVFVAYTLEVAIACWGCYKEASRERLVLVDCLPFCLVALSIA